jgi:hypothetical protein
MDEKKKEGMSPPKALRIKGFSLDGQGMKPLGIVRLLGMIAGIVLSV